MTEWQVPKSFSAVVIWILATSVGFATTGSAGLIWQGIVPCALIQALVLSFWNRSLSWRWLLGTVLVGMPGALAAIVVMLIAGSSGVVPDAIAVGLGGAVAGTAMGVGGWLALRVVNRNMWGWVLLSGVAWAAGAGFARLILESLDPHGMGLFHELTGAGLSSASASRIVSMSSGALTGFFAGAASAGGVILMVARRTFRDSAPV